MRVGWVAIGIAFVVAGCGGSSIAPDASTTDAQPIEGDTGVDAAVLLAPRVDLTSGPVVGTRGAGYQAFLGIPYAAPPVGDLRWRSPAPVVPWTTPLNATSAPPRCLQHGFGFDLPGQEDCLYVNVHIPDPMPANAPVMVWIHGGGFVFGEGLQADGGTAGDLLAARHGVVVVSFNYRLGAYGFLSHEAIDDPSRGNFGFADQVAALHWVHDNIASFGGDPGKVTIVGESAGGVSVCLHLIAPASNGLFTSAISESGLCDSALPLIADADAAGATLATTLGCTTGDVAACLRSKTVDEIAAAQPSSGAIEELTSSSRWWPHLDGSLLPGDFRLQVIAGEFANVPTIIGWNHDEGTLFIMLAEMGGLVFDATEYDAAMVQLAAQFGVDADAIRAQYPLASYPDAGAAVAAALGHAALACPSRRAARLLAQAGAPVRVYNFVYPHAAFQIATTRTLGAFHSSEIQYVFGHPARLGQRAFTGADIPLSDAMMGYWAQFVTHADPNGTGTNWPAYDLTGDADLILDATITSGTGADATNCALWNGT